MIFFLIKCFMLSLSLSLSLTGARRPGERERVQFVFLRRPRESEKQRRSYTKQVWFGGYDNDRGFALATIVKRAVQGLVGDGMQGDPWHTLNPQYSPLDMMFIGNESVPMAWLPASGHEIM